MARPDLRRNDEMRKIKITPDCNLYAEGSVLIEVGNTRVLCTASVEETVPSHVKGTGRGWVTAEYAMLPRATNTRNAREIEKMKKTGRSAEIQRLIGRSLRAAIDLNRLGERSIVIDCDVLQADGGTRCASITGGFVALALACRKLVKQGVLTRSPLKCAVSAVSAGLFEEEPILDLCYSEDSRAQVDCNVVMTDGGDLVEIQGTGEERAFSREELNKMLSLGRKGCAKLAREQKKIVGDMIP